MDSEEIIIAAKKRVTSKKKFIHHLISYLGVIGLLYVIMNYGNNGNMLPVSIVAISWGIGLAIHYFNAYGTDHLGDFGFNSDWEEEELEKEINKLTRRRELKEQILEEKRLINDLEQLELKEIERNPLYRNID